MTRPQGKRMRTTSSSRQFNNGTEARRTTTTLVPALVLHPHLSTHKSSSTRSLEGSVEGRGGREGLRGCWPGQEVVQGVQGAQGFQGVPSDLAGSNRA